MRFAALVLAGNCLLPACSGESGEPAASKATQPYSVLLLTIDTLRPDYMSGYGYDRPTTPYLDELLAGAFHFERAVTPVPRTTPALASLLTGAYPHTHKVRRLHDSLDTSAVSLAEYLGVVRDYQTVAVVTNRVIETDRKLNRGFQIYDQAPDTRTAEKTTAAALRRLQKLDQERAIFAWVHYIDPHMPYETGEELVRSFDPGYEGRYARSFGTWEGQERNKGNIRNRSPYPKDLPTPEAVHRNPLAEEVNAHIRRLYAADIRHTDNQLKLVVEKMRELSRNRLIIVFTSDHGESLGEHDYYWFHGDYAYNAAGRIPLAFLLPEEHPLHASGRSEQWASLVDVVPSLLEILGEVPTGDLAAQIEGRSLVPVMQGQQAEAVPVFIESGRAHHFKEVRCRQSNTIAGRIRAVCLGDWKLIWTPGASDPCPSWQLYNVAADSHEINNLYREDHPEFLRLKKALLPWVTRSLDGLTEDEDLGAEEASLLSELGYAAEED